MRLLFLAAGAAVLLAGCGKSEPTVEAKDATAGEVAQKVREAGADQSIVRPGLWESNVTIQQLDMPGMPAEVQQRMKAMMAEKQEHKFQTCLTAEDVKRPKEDFFAGKNNECRYDNFTMGGGKIDAVMHCGKGGAKQTMQMAGTYSPESYEMQMSTKTESGGAEARGMAMRMRVEAHRIGECTGKEG